MRYRLGLDIGAKSIGWSAVRLDQTNQPVGIIKAGVRIFSDGRNPKDGTSLAVTRRLARQMRRRRDRLLRRKERLLTALQELGFLPPVESERRALVALDPWTLRKKGLDEALTPQEFGRALFHINQRRGFKSNRRTEGKKEDSSVLKAAIRQVQEELTRTQARTIGEWLAIRHAAREGVRARLQGRTAKEGRYDLYIDRTMVEAEFDAIWQRQAALNPTLFNEAARLRLRDILLFQRALRPVIPGRCTLLPEERRAPLALPCVQRFRIYQEANNLRVLGEQMRETPLTRDQRDTLVNLLEKGDVTFAGIRRALKLPAATRFNLEDAKRDKLKGNATSKLLARDELFGPRWHQLPPVVQDEIVVRLKEDENEASIVQWLTEQFGLDAAAATALASVSLPEGYGNLSRAAIDHILPELQKAVCDYASAVRAAGFETHSALSHAEATGEILDQLPYYGEGLQRHVGFGTGHPDDPAERRYGRIANPTVHIGLNELRKVVNALIQQYGHPSQIVVELARELKQGKALRDEIQREQAQRQKENEDYREKIRGVLGGGDPTAEDLQRMRLWVELNRSDATNRRCPYTGEQISIEMLFSSAVEVDHILPFSRTLDDGLNNKTLALRRANRDKGNRTPAEAFGHCPPGYDYPEILERAALMPRTKAVRFAADGYERWLREDQDFLARALNDTAYLSRLAKEYLTLICPKDQVWVIPGRLTAMLRGRFGLNRLLSGSSEKNRDDHRHHAIDACVVAVTDRSLLQRVAHANARARDKGLDRLVEEMPAPFPAFREHVERAVSRIVVSHRPDHGYQGALHNETAYGLGPSGTVIHRVPLEYFGSAEEIRRTSFQDESFKQWLLDKVGDTSGKEYLSRVDALRAEHRVRRVRIVEKLNVVQVTDERASYRHGRDEAGRPRAYKGYKGDSNHCIEIFLAESGKWEGKVISTFEAYQVVRQRGEAALRDRVRSQNGRCRVPGD
jgi:CRISPR-associated endonuclease Csn1